ncbi:GntR family transcriptional regulator (plasmid) [Embleya sp. NBC_00888]|uniref:GntR family transcriptional regulator n=1 Tax=Embleya sp. NBC_00888 TaxID=2975960 RepID=UPI002F90D3B1|nr:GntR family transcriptional regulator [Embleya sp. NBC_00888]
MSDRQTRSMQVRDRLVELFRVRGLVPGDRLPTESEIAELCEVGRSTAREALKLLEQEGLVSIGPGRGRYLSSLSSLDVERPITRYESVTTMLDALGYTARTVVLSVTEEDPGPVEREALRLAEGARVIRLERLRFDGDDPLVYSVDTLPRECVPGPVRHIDWTGSLNDLLAAQNCSPESSAARLRAVDLPAEAIERYSLQGLGPWLLVSETVITATGRPVLYAEDYHRGSVFTFNVLRR